MSKLGVQKFVFSPFMENTYIIWNNQTNEGAVIDPGCNSEGERDEVQKFIKENSISLKYLINTHCHIDHIFGNAFIKNNYDVKFIAPEEDSFLLKNAVEQAEMYAVKMEPSPEPDEFIYDGMAIDLGDIKNEFLFTPGHTPGEYSIYFEDEKICFTGDVLFKEGIGRTDLWGGNTDTILNSIKTRLLTLPPDTKIYSGHGEESTVLHEKQNNPFLT
ncbi:MAG: MBL fold metallo-hydrolase [Melioribacteraceae bacterium]|nr:MBL fold metallo-hydrolase [Melioribacteraceae bacterium]